MNMFKAVAAKTVDEYLASVPEDRKETINFLHEFIQKSAPSLKPHFAYNMLGYGSFQYKNYKGDVIPWPTVSLANQKNYISLYICAVENGEYIAEKYKQSLANSVGKAKLGKVSVGKSCIRFKKVGDLNLDALKEVIKKAEKSPGLVSASELKKK